MKKKISMFLAVVMIVTLLPAMGVFGATTNSISTQPQLADDFNFGEGKADAPVLTIKGGDGVSSPASTLTFRLSLTNAEWAFADGTAASAGATLAGAVPVAGTNAKQFTLAGKATVLNDGNTTKAGTATVHMNIVGPSIAEVTLTNLNSTGPIPALDMMFVKDSLIQIPMVVELKGTGESSVTIGGNASDFGITVGTYTFAYGGSGSTKTTVAKTSNFADELEISTILIDEIIPGTLKDGTLTLTAPNGFEFSTTTGITVVGGGKLAGTGVAASSIRYGTYGGNEDKSVLEIVIGGITKTTTRGSLLVSGVKLVAEDEDAPKGDVSISFKGIGMTQESVKVGTFVGYDVIMEAEDKDLPVLIAGQYPSSPVDDDIKALKVTFKEGATDAWSAMRRTNFKFPDGVKPRAVDIKTTNLDNSKNVSGVSIYNATGGSYTVSSLPGMNGSWDLDDDGLVVRREKVTPTKKAEIELTFYLSVEPGYEGDITVTATGDALPNEVSATIATAVSPFSVQSGTTSVEIGTKGILVTDITITETVAGAIQKSGANTYSYTDKQSEDTLVIAVEDMAVENNSAKVEVTSGDLVLEKVYYGSAFFASTGSRDNNALKLTVKRASNEASTLKITGATINADRTLPQGDYELRIGGSVCANYSNRSKLIHATFDKSYFIGDEDFIKIITGTGLNSERSSEKVSVTIGSTTMLVGENEVEMDVAPFIEGGYTYIPVSFVAIASGLKETEVVWNAVDKSVMIYTANRTVKLVKDSNVITINGIDTVISSPVLIRNNRVFVPFRVLGEQVLGAPVGWEEATRTATFY